MGEFLDYSYKGFNYKLYVPSDYQEETEFPLMVLLHGCHQNPDDFAAGTKMNQLAEQENFLVLYPNMKQLFNPLNLSDYNPFGCWNWFLDNNQHRDMGHPKFIYTLINEVTRNYRVDSNKVFAAGLSAGAALACILGVTYPDVFNGIGVCAGLPYGAANVSFLTDPMAKAASESMQQGVSDPFACGNSAFEEMGRFRKKMPVIVFHGICDTIVHPINAQQVIIQWIQTNFLINGGKGKADVTPMFVKSDFMNGKSYTQHVYSDGCDNPLLELWMIDQMGHTWSGGSPNGSYTDPLGPNATEIIWNFFKRSSQTPVERSGLLEHPGRIEQPAQPEQFEHPKLPAPSEQFEYPGQPAPSEQFVPLEQPEQSEQHAGPAKKNLFRTLLEKLFKKRR